MKYDFVLTFAQQVLVEEHLSVIDTVLGLFINTDETVCGLGYRDLYQEGAVALCRAASTYNGTSASFSTYAKTLIVVLSSINVVSSSKSCSIRAVRISSHTPAFVQARNRLYTLCHGPNRSGRSLHGIPVFSQYRIALSISRLLLPGRPPCGFFSGGNLSRILSRCFSLISCLFMYFILSTLHTISKFSNRL